MKGKYIIPKVNHIYRNKNGSCYRCVEVTEEYSVFISVVSGWTMRVHGVQLYKDGSITGDYSEGGHFVRV